MGMPLDHVSVLRIREIRQNRQAFSGFVRDGSIKIAMKNCWYKMEENLYAHTVCFNCVLLVCIQQQFALCTYYYHVQELYAYNWDYLKRRLSGSWRYEVFKSSYNFGCGVMTLVNLYAHNWELMLSKFTSIIEICKY